nr:NP1 [Rodent bocavirus]
MNRTNGGYAGFKRKRSDSPRPEQKKIPHRMNGEKGSDASHNLTQNQQSSTALRPCRTPQTKKKNEKYNPYHIFSKHNAIHNPGLGFCGYHWHSTRLARAGTEMIFNGCKQKFQEYQNDGQINWEQTKEILFFLKKEMDQKYRNMLWHFKNTQCNKCEYWDNVFTRFTANISESPQDDPTDEECLKAAMDVDGSSE